MSESKIIRIQELTKELNTYRDEYYNLNKPSISDSIYDKLFDELKLLENETGFKLGNSPTQTIGYEVKSKLEKRIHPTPLKSLDKTKSIDELNKWRNNKDIILMLKADGLTVELDYENGIFVGGYTRGNGEIGEVITHNCKVFKNIPLSIPFKGKLRISGEAIIHKNDFDMINSKLYEDEKYATPRNLVSGSVRQLDSKICAERKIYFYAFNILECSEELIDNKYQRFNFLKKLGFTIIPLIWSGINSCNIETITADINALKNWALDIEMPIDGIVSTFNSVSYSNSLSETSHHPLHSMAFKFADESETTTLRDIEWSVGRTGCITPVAIFDTVILDNTEVSRASLHNLSICENLELGIGDSISIIKANMIIPQVVENFTKSDNLIIPDKCPICGGITIIDQLNDSKVLYCTNEDCSAKLLKKFSHFVSRNAMNIEGLSEATIEKFLDSEFLVTFSDIYKLEQYKSQIVKMDGFGLRSYTKLVEAIEKSKSIKFENFVYSLGIKQIGLGGAKRLAKHFKNDINKFLEATKSPSNFINIEDFGSITVCAVCDYFKNEDNINQVKELLTFITIKQEENKVDNNLKDLSGLSFVVTGNVTTFKNRKELEELITTLGGKLNSSVSNKTNYLINNDTQSTSGKNQKAKELNVKIISEVDFNLMIGRN